MYDRQVVRAAPPAVDEATVNFIYLCKKQNGGHTCRWEGLMAYTAPPLQIQQAIK